MPESLDMLIARLDTLLDDLAQAEAGTAAPSTPSRRHTAEER